MLKSKNFLILIGKNVIISLIVVIISLVAIFFLKNQIEKITNTIVLNHKLETELKERTELLAVIDRGAQIIGKNDALINNAFIPSNNISEFINKLDDLVFISGMVQAYRFDTPTPSTMESPYPLSIITYSNSLTSDMPNLLIYLKNFEKLPYFTQIESLYITSQDKVGWTGLSNISMKAKLYTKTTQ